MTRWVGDLVLATYAAGHDICKQAPSYILYLHAYAILGKPIVTPSVPREYG